MLRMVGAVTLGALVGLVGVGSFAACGGDDFVAVPSTGGAGGAGGSGATGGEGGDPSTTTQGGGGAGGMPPQCFDADMDGVTDCEGDCDDDDPNSFPGNIENCGDGVDNDCDDTPDQVDACPGNLGTYVSSITGDDNNDGTQASPVATIDKGIDNALALGNGQPVYVAEGTYGKVVLEDGVSLLGGHQCDLASCTWARDPDGYVSDIQNVDDQGVYGDIFVTSATRVDGFTITGFTNPSPGNGSMTAAVTLEGATAILSNNKIFGGDRVCSQCDTRAVWIIGPANDPITGVLIEDNEITAGDAQDRCPAVAHTFGGAPRVQLHRNRIKGGACRLTRAVSMSNASFGTEIHDNEIFAGRSTGNGTYDGSFAVIISGYADIDGNRINHDPAETGNCEIQGSAAWCGGIEVEGLSGSITNNLIHGIPAEQRSVGIFLGEGEVSSGLVYVNGNTIDGAGLQTGGGTRAGTSAALTCVTGPGVNAVVGEVRNNILLGGEGNNRYGFFEPNQGSKTCRPIAYENNDIFFSATVIATDVVHRHWSGSQATNLDLTGLNNEAWATDNFQADPLFDTAAYPHLQATSPCIDAGVATGAPAVDIDDDPRPAGAGIDVGCDEAG